MENYGGTIYSKLPKSGTTIFTVMSALAAEYNAINLSQGFPDFHISEKLINLVNHYMNKGFNQYAPMAGVLKLREVISEKVKYLYNAVYIPDKEISITSGGTQAIFTILSAFIREGDEAIIIEPAYDSYAPGILLNGGVPKYSALTLPDYKINWEEVKKIISHKTKVIIINSPHNPSGSVLSSDDMKMLEDITNDTDIIVISDEVYEHLIFDGIRHESVCRYGNLSKRSFMVGSFGKTFHTTGWKIGYVLAPENLMIEFRKAHQFIVFSANTPVQYALADFLEDRSNWDYLNDFYQKKRDYFVNLISSSRFKIIPSHGTYFQLLDYSNISNEEEANIAVRLTKEFGIASVPVSAFYHKKIDNYTLRFCFAKKEETLEKAAEIICKI